MSVLARFATIATVAGAALALDPAALAQEASLRGTYTLNVDSSAGPVSVVMAFGPGGRGVATRGAMRVPFVYSAIGTSFSATLEAKAGFLGPHNATIVFRGTAPAAEVDSNGKAVLISTIVAPANPTGYETLVSNFTVRRNR